MTAQKIRDVLNRCEDVAGHTEAHVALVELEELARWAAAARSYLEAMACRYRRDGDQFGEVETAARLLSHPEISKRCAYGVGDELRCRYHRLVDGNCAAEVAPMSEARQDPATPRRSESVNDPTARDRTVSVDHRTAVIGARATARIDDNVELQGVIVGVTPRRASMVCDDGRQRSFAWRRITQSAPVQPELEQRREERPPPAAGPSQQSSTSVFEAHCPGVKARRR